MNAVCLEGAEACYIHKQAGFELTGEFWKVVKIVSSCTRKCSALSGPATLSQPLIAIPGVLSAPVIDAKR